MTVVTSLDSPYVANLDIQVYYDGVERRDPPLGGTIDTVDLDVQHRFMPGGRHDVVRGFGYRLTHDAIDGSLTFRLRPPRRTVHLFSFFAQDEISLSQTRLILGSKIEHNDFTGLEWQPNDRFVWLPAPDHTLWAASGHAVRLPNRVEVDERFVAAVYGPGEYRERWPPLVLAVLGNPDYRSETVTALDVDIRLGWRSSTGLEVELVGRHLLADRRLEYARQTVIAEPTRVRRAWHGGLTWRF